jgi:hypothetical protein
MQKFRSSSGGVAPGAKGMGRLSSFTAISKQAPARLKARAATVSGMLKLRRPRLGALNASLLVVLLGLGGGGAWLVLGTTLVARFARRDLRPPTLRW